MQPSNALFQLFRAPNYNLLDPGDAKTIRTERQLGVVGLISATTETRTLAAPTKAGILLTLQMVTDGGDITVTVTGTYDGSNSTLVFADPGDWVIFHSIESSAGTYRWAVLGSRGVAQLYPDDLDVHGLTAAGAVPAAADLIPTADESESGDPTVAVTVLELLSAAGDMTDLAAAPALDDRLLVTDESATGDPAKSMSVQNLLDARATAVNSSGVGAKTGATVAAAETGVPGHLMKTTLTCTATGITISDEAGQGQYGGVKVYDFPAGTILLLGAMVDGALTAGVTGTIIDNWDGDVGLGVEAPSDHQDATNKTGSVMQKNDVSAGASDKIGVVKALSKATALTESGSRWLDGNSAAIDLFLNFLIDDDASHTAGTATFTGTITFWWINLGLLTA